MQQNIRNGACELLADEKTEEQMSANISGLAVTMGCSTWCSLLGMDLTTFPRVPCVATWPSSSQGHVSQMACVPFRHGSWWSSTCNSLHSYPICQQMVRPTGWGSQRMKEAWFAESLCSVHMTAFWLIITGDPKGIWVRGPIITTYH